MVAVRRMRGVSLSRQRMLGGWIDEWLLFAKASAQNDRLVLRRILLSEGVTYFG